MEHKTIAASASPTTDQGEFTAIAAAWTVDRELDVIHRGAFTQTIGQWRDSGKNIPLHWDHRGEPQNIIGHIDPSSMEETDDGLLVKGHVDFDNPVAREAWRLIKQGTVGLSFGYLASKKSDRPAGGRDLFEIDMFEVSITPAPMHPDTKITGWKSQTAEIAPDPTELRRKTELSGREQIEDQLRDVPEVREPDPEPEPEPEPEPVTDPVLLRRRTEKAAKWEERTRIAHALKNVPEVREPDPEPEPEPVPDPEPPPDPDVLRRQTAELVREEIKNQLAEVPEVKEPPPPEPEPEPEPIPDEGELRRKTAGIEREQIKQGLATIETKVTKEPFSTSHTSNWVARAGGLPAYIQHVAHDLMQERGMGESQAIQMAIGICQRWARGEGGVSADTKAKAAAAIAEWDKMKAKTGKALNPEQSDWTQTLNAAADDYEIAQVTRVSELEERVRTLEESLTSFEKALHRQAVARPRPDNDLRRRSEQAVLDVQLDGVSMRKSPPVQDDDTTQAPAEDQLRRQTRDQYLEIITQSRR